MVKFLCNWIASISKLKIILLFLILFITALVLVNIIFPTGVQNITQTFNYSPQKAYSMFEEYGQIGREKHLRVLFADIILVILYTILFSTSILYTFSRILPSSLTWWHKVSLLPFVLAIIQLLEIVGVFILLQNYPKELLMIATITNYITVIKFILTAICIIVPVIGFLLLIIKNTIVFVRRLI